jgi:tetratricopeptide (TPR) repeat protein
MARAERRRAQRAKPAPVARTRRSGAAIEDTMFFPRIRRHAKWVFVFLALAFGLGFVGFGVGAGGVGIGDILKGSGGGSGVPSISSSQKRIEKNPTDAQAYRDLATAYQTKGDVDNAISALSQFTNLKPKNVDVLRELAALYLRKASDAQQRAQVEQLRAQYLAPASAVLSSLTIGQKSFDVDPLNQALAAQASEAANAAYGEVQSAAQSAVDSYKRIAAAQPRNPTVQLELAQTAQSTSDTTTAIAAYKKFLKLAPNDPSVPDVKRLLKQLGAK